MIDNQVGVYKYPRETPRSPLVCQKIPRERDYTARMKFSIYSAFALLLVASYAVDIEAEKPTATTVTVTITAPAPSETTTTKTTTSKTTTSKATTSKTKTSKTTSTTKTTLTTSTSSATKSSCAPTAPAGTQSLYGQCMYILILFLVWFGPVLIRQVHYYRRWLELLWSYELSTRGILPGWVVG